MLPDSIQNSIDYIKQVCDLERKTFSSIGMDGPFIAISGVIKNLELELQEILVDK